MHGTADQCVRFWNFHARDLCSPTRSSFLTGRIPTSNGMATLAELA
jgi:arylsulfatase A-like enzyme